MYPPPTPPPEPRQTQPHLPGIGPSPALDGVRVDVGRDQLVGRAHINRGRRIILVAELVANSGAADQVHFAGIVDDVENYLRAADISILASSREGTPNSVLEAMATGLPCVVTPYLGLSEGIGKPGEHYLLVEREEGAIAGALGDLLDAVTDALVGLGYRDQVTAQGPQARLLDMVQENGVR